jgi:hypothetical protein
MNLGPEVARATVVAHQYLGDLSVETGLCPPSDERNYFVGPIFLENVFTS